MRAFKTKSLVKLLNVTSTRTNATKCISSAINYEFDLENLEKVTDISECVSSNKSSLKITSKDYYSQYSDSFFKDSYQKMVKDIENVDEFNPQFSLTKKFEEESLISIEPGVIKSANSILKIQLKVTKEQLGEKKRLRLDDYLYKSLIFAVFHYNDNIEDLSQIQLRFRLFSMYLICI